MNLTTEMPTTTLEPPGVVPLPSRINFDEYLGVDPRYSVGMSTDVAKSIFDLGNKLTTLLLQTRSSKFEVISPLSIVAALNVVLLGSKGETFNELMNTLGYSRCKLLFLLDSSNLK